MKTNAVGFIRLQLQGLFSELSIILFQSDATELDKASDYISVSFNDIHVLSLITPVNHKRESQLFYLYFCLSSLNAQIATVAQIWYESFKVKLLPPNTQNVTQPPNLTVKSCDLTVRAMTEICGVTERSVTYMSGHCTEIGLGYQNDSGPNWWEKAAIQQDIPRSCDSSPNPPQLNSWSLLSGPCFSFNEPTHEDQ